jgi:hypothetical protein
MPSDADRRREELRQTFETVPALYDRGRPTYPDELFVDLSLVIRPAALAAFTRAKLAAFPEAEVVSGEFERTSFDGSFDAVVAFTSFHWIDPAVRYAKAASLLRARGILAVTEVSHVRVEGDDPFWVEVQADYDAVVPGPDNRPPPLLAEVGDLLSEIAATGLFADVEVRRYVWQVTYGAAEYIDLLGTYSPNTARDPDTALELLRRIRARIEARDEARVTYLATMNIARL